MEEENIKFNRNNFGPPDISPDELTYIQQIGDGSYGCVFEGECRGVRVAIKRLFKQDYDEDNLKEFRKEVELCSRLNHPNVLLFMGACTVPGEMAIVTELCERGNLETLLHNEQANLSLYRKLIMAKQCASGMAWLHGSDPLILHRDIKPSNLLVDKHGDIKVCDFGLSAIKPSHEKIQDGDQILGSPLWMAPEVMQGNPVDEKADVYSYGCVLWEIVTQEPLFEDQSDLQEFVRLISDGMRPPLDGIEQESIKELLSFCWAEDPMIRPSFPVIIEYLDAILVESAVKSSEGRIFWSKRFRGESRAEFCEFLPAFLEDHNLGVPTQIQLDCFKHLFVTMYTDDIMKPIEVITLENFNKLLEGFGPINTLVKKGKKEKFLSIFERIENICKHHWFHGTSSSKDAEKLLSTTTAGTFLIRVSTTVPNSFTLSRNAVDKIFHHRITYTRNRGIYQARVGSNNPEKKFEEFSSHSLKNVLSSLKEHYGLTSPAPNSPLRYIFKEKTVNSNCGIYETEFD